MKNVKKIMTNVKKIVKRERLIFKSEEYIQPSFIIRKPVSLLIIHTVTDKLLEFRR